MKENLVQIVIQRVSYFNAFFFIRPLLTKLHKSEIVKIEHFLDHTREKEHMQKCKEVRLKNRQIYIGL